MKVIWTIAKKELSSYFDTLIAYIMLAVFLGFSGFFTWLYGSDIFLVGQASLQSFFGVAYWTLFFFAPALTMRLLAEENNTGTIELLLTKAVTDWQVVLGKFTGCLLLICIALAATLPYYVTISQLGSVDHAAIWCGYLGIILMSASYVSIGLFCSSITRNQIVAFLLALLVGIFFHIIFSVLAGNVKGVLGVIFDYIGIASHYEAITRGVIDSKDMVYFFSFIFLGLLATEAVLSRRNITN